jgi:Na+-translocating ferredoxin:NAD+ oxidoreductase RnfG subunit
MSADSLELRRFGGEIDGITSATISSERVTSAVRVTVEAVS